MKKDRKPSAELEEMCTLVSAWAQINSHTKNHAGLEKLTKKIETAFQILQPDLMQRVPCGENFGLFLKKREKAPIQLFLGGHLDTVFPEEDPFQTTTWIDKNRLRGPGVTDMKGGLVILLKAVEAFEKLPCADKIGWEIFLNPDEEVGSPDSKAFIEGCAERCDLALLFEPALPDGALVSSRKGSANFMIRSRGKRAHAGRGFAEGKHAIYPLARLIVESEQWHQPSQGDIVNVGIVKGGEAFNIIPDYAECGLNVRTDTLQKLVEIRERLTSLTSRLGLELEHLTWNPPKPLDPTTESLLHELRRCGAQIDLDISWRATGGVCDGNTFASKGVPTIDTLGALGGEIHTENEYLDVNSLSERAQLTTLFLKEIALDKIKIGKKDAHS